MNSTERIFKGYYIDEIDIIFYVCDFLSRVNLNFFFFCRLQTEHEIFRVYDSYVR